jgi:alkylation response protein AidB-like acyl-CoA dehydrogenase
VRVRTPGAAATDRLTLSFGAVDFDLSPDQVDLRDAAADLLDGLASPERLRAFVGPGTGDPDAPVPGAVPRLSSGDGFDRALWEGMATQGWLGVERPEEEGGLGLGMVEVAVLCEELGRRAAPVPFVGSILCLKALDEAAADGALAPRDREAAAEWAGRLAGGEAVGCVAWSAEAGSITARSGDGWWWLSGRPEPTQYASVADVAVVMAADGLFAVPLGALDGADRPKPEPAMDPTRPLAWLRMGEVRAHRIGGIGSDSRMLDRAATAAAALLLGASARVLDLSVEYAKVRRQFGKPIGSFQAVKHRLADALVDVEGMRSSTYYAAWCLATRDPEGPLAASMAKAWCSDASRRVTATGLQVHGGIGFTWEHELHLHVKRAQLDATSFGDATWHRDRIAGMLRRRLTEGRAPI